MKKLLFVPEFDTVRSIDTDRSLRHDLSGCEAADSVEKSKSSYTLTIFFLCLFTQNIVFSQWSDDFSDGDFENNPSWTGNTEHFIVDNGWLRLNAPAAAGTSYLAVASDIV